MVISNKTSRADMERIRACTRQMITDCACLPVSYVIGGKKYTGIPAEFRPRTKKKFVDSNIIERTYTGVDPETKLEITAECTEYLDFPMVEWVLWLENTGDTDSPVISDLYGMDGFLPCKAPKLVHNTGDTCDDDMFIETVTDLTEAKHFEQAPDGGRASDCAWPYYRVLDEDFGYTIAVGWPGQWNSTFDMAPGGFRMTAKQTYTHFYLKPGEKVRTPRMSIMTFEGDMTRGINLWRRWMLAHAVPKVHGDLPKPLAFVDNRGKNILFEEETEETQIHTLDSLKASGIDYDGFWLDAGWYECTMNGEKDWHFTGHFVPDHERFPNGLMPVAKKCREEGKEFILWFEPERVKLGMIPQAGYPADYVLPLKDESAIEKMRFVGSSTKLVDKMGIFDLSRTECCDWLIEFLDRMIKETGITIYRQDFNFPPLHYWLQNDTPDRLGITENLYNQGYLRLWDELRLRNPDVWINSVSAGGRRSDLETMRRSASLHQSDHGTGKHRINQATLAFSAAWQPYHGAFANEYEEPDGTFNVKAHATADKQEINEFMFQSACCTAFKSRVGEHCIFMPDGEYGKTDEAKMYNEFMRVWRMAAPYMLRGDFYLLSLTDRQNTNYHAMQYHMEDDDAGYFQVIRNVRAPEDVFTVYLRQIDETKTYILEAPKSGKTVKVSGAALVKDGFDVAIPPRTGEMWLYHAIKE